MSYPSLLFSEKASGRRIAAHVFEDVKLNAFFSEESIGAMRALCRSEDIPVRQDLLAIWMANPPCGRPCRSFPGSRWSCCASMPLCRT